DTASADHDTVQSALGTPARGSVQFAGSSPALLAGLPVRVLGGTFMAALPVWKVVALELGGLGYHTKAPATSAPGDAPGEMGLGVMAGLRLALPSEWLRPYATARFAHIFGATDNLWRAHPFANLAGQMGDAGVRHTIGASIGAGVEAPLGAGA